ncbi:LacI family transcriptional regulator [Phragmitibacter flavus]|uniref:LacI family transcriptional regulator n=1 Tax=Phragmitibacter flavus TaxID=2576071 RepID=A0A5R8KAN9_9BACT|nr:LacI family DNA-binding transcriptional regulator [Phragmitibacter flavus]TLD69373.1 LacI family transcriptional regulator [Phragmitibacter flavus]
MSESAVSLHDIAKHAGVTAMTVSRVLRRLPGAGEETRRKVMESAEALGYAPNPDLTRAMQLVRSKKSRTNAAVIAVVREEIPGDDLLDGACHFMPMEFLQRSAESHGYRVEEFWLGRDGLTAGRLSGILHARGIEGIIVSPQSVSMPCSKLDFSKFASVTVGYALKEPSLHRSATNVVPGMKFVFDRLLERGYRRIGIAIAKWVDDRTQNIYSSSMLRFQYELPQAECVPMLNFAHNDIRHDEDLFCAWIREHRPEVIISYEQFVPQWLRKMGLRIPEDIGLVVHDWVPGMTGWAAINHRRDYIAEGAVDLLVMQMMRRERGVPTVPRQISIPPEWVEGESIKEKG